MSTPSGSHYIKGKRDTRTKCDGIFCCCVFLAVPLLDCPMWLYCSIMSTIPFMIETFSFYSTHYPKLKTVDSLETIITRCPHGVNTRELNCFTQPNERATGSLGGLYTYRLGTFVSTYCSFAERLDKHWDCTARKKDSL